MTAGVVVLVLLAGGTWVLKAAGPLVLGGGRELPGWLERLSLLLPAALLAALVVTTTVVADRAWVSDARLVGLAAAAVALRLRANFAAVVVVAALATAGTRALLG